MREPMTLSRLGHGQVQPFGPERESESGNQPQTLAEQAFARLRRDILYGLRPPGEKLRIKMLKQAYAIGPSPLREALSRLVSTGLVVAQGQQGFFVAPISIVELCDVTTNRIWAQSIALRLAIANANRESEAEIMAATHLMGQIPEGVVAGDLETWDAAHTRFHLALIAGCGSAQLIRHCVQMQELSQRYSWLSRPKEERLPRDIDGEHRGLRDAFLTRDADTATRLIAEHLMETASRTIRTSFDEAEAQDWIRKLRMGIEKVGSVAISVNNNPAHA